MQRPIGVVDELQYLNELQVYFHKENRFRLVTIRDFPQNSISGHCELCPISINKISGTPYSCQAKISTWEKFKQHISNAERIIGELIAFPIYLRDLPSKSTYKKFREYGNLHKYQNQDSFYFYDKSTSTFSKINRCNLLRKTQTSRKRCGFCPCSISILSTNGLIRHLQTLETRYYCHLILDRLEQNDDRNMKRIQGIFEKKNAMSRSRALFVSDNDQQNDDLDENFESDCDQKSFVHKSYTNEDEDDNENDEDDDEKISILNQLETTFRNMQIKIKEFIKQARKNILSQTLEEGLIDSQKQLILCKRVEDFKLKQKDLTFEQNVSLKYEDLDFLMKKFDISNELYEIDESSITLTIQLNDGQLTPSQQLIPFDKQLSKHNHDSKGIDDMEKTFKNISSDKNETSSNNQQQKIEIENSNVRHLTHSKVIYKEDNKSQESNANHQTNDEFKEQHNQSDSNVINDLSKNDDTMEHDTRLIRFEEIMFNNVRIKKERDDSEFGLEPLCKKTKTS